jgi:AcrR family transcriptional regulator
MTQADAVLASTPAGEDRTGRDRGSGEHSSGEHGGDYGGGEPGGGEHSGGQADPSTRERILDVALDLFTDRGFDATSMREIADRLRITKPSIYYHFASKEDILLALHLRLHGFVRPAFAQLRGQTMTLQIWDSLLGELLDQMVAQRKLFLMHERNQAAMEKLHLHRKDHEDEHEDIHLRLRLALADPALSLRDRVRMACSLGTVIGPLFMAGNAFDNVPGAELGALVRDAVRDVMADRRA